MKVTTIWVFLAITIACISCKKKEVSTTTYKEDPNTKLTELRFSKLEKIKNKYNIKYALDTLNIKYSVDFDSVIDSKYQLITEFNLLDIFAIDSTHLALIKVDKSHGTYYYYLTINYEHERILRNNQKNLHEFDWSTNKDYDWLLYNNSSHLIVSITSIVKNRFSITSEVESDLQILLDGNEHQVYDVILDIDAGSSFSGYGNVIEVI